MSTSIIIKPICLGRLPIIGVGGLFTGQDAYDKIKAGASLIQLYTSFVYHGPPRISRIKQELDILLRWVIMILLNEKLYSTSSDVLYMCDYPYFV